VPLEEYKKKRDFGKTKEPPPSDPSERKGPLTFVVQKHAARRLHYDFRLELGGVLVSWAVPSGPSLDTSQKRLAAHVEDHPLDYASFEGVIPKGQYGAGQVIVWDQGTYSPDEGGKLSFDDRAEAEARVRQELEAGKISIQLRGQKLKGSWALVRMSGGKGKDWLLLKHRDAHATTERDVLDDDRSVVSGLTIEDLKAGRLPDRYRRPSAPPAAALTGARPAPFPQAAKPMLAALADGPFSRPGWVYEPKLDGARVIALVKDGKATLLSRRGLDVTQQYPALAAELGEQTANVVLDGEIVALDDDGRPSFELLQTRLNARKPSEVQKAEAAVSVLYYVFDILHLDGSNLARVPLIERKAALAQALVRSPHVLYVDHFEEDGLAVYEAVTAQGLEGMIAKRAQSIYEEGKRSDAWLKVKSTRSDDFIIGGYTRGDGSRSKSFGALLVGVRDANGQLAYVCRVGSGFDDGSLAGLREQLAALQTDACPFSTTPDLDVPATWVRPELVAEVKFANWTSDGHLRAPVFLRLREDKDAAEAGPTGPVRVAGRIKRGAPSGPLLENSSATEQALDQLNAAGKSARLSINGQTIALSNLDKELWPPLETRPPVTKKDYLAYLIRMAPYLLAWLRDRPLTLIRRPDGIEGPSFYQKHASTPVPDFVERVWLYSDHANGDQEYLLCNNLPTLVWLGQLANLEFHSWFSRTSPVPDGYHLTTDFAGSAERMDGSLLNYPDFILFDLDPYIYSGHEKKGAEPELNRKGFAQACQVALWLKEVLDSLSLASFVKTSGRTGLHVCVPVTRRLDYRAIRNAAGIIGQHLVQAHPKDVTVDWSVSKRTGKVFFDYNQNTRGKTFPAPYSTRPAPEATVSMPLRWEELTRPGLYPTDFTTFTAPARMAQTGDLWADFLEAKHDLETVLGITSAR
jgi:bifunctional non-homologous end joining protein LigD